MTVATREKEVTRELVLEVLDAFNSRDADRIASQFTEDCTFYMASGPEPVGRTVRGRAAIRTLMADRFKAMPDLRWEHKYEYVCGHRAVSVCTVKGTMKDGRVLNHQGCDLWEFKNGLVHKKDTYWKIVQPDA